MFQEEKRERSRRCDGRYVPFIAARTQCARPCITRQVGAVVKDGDAMTDMQQPCSRDRPGQTLKMLQLDGRKEWLSFPHDVGPWPCGGNMLMYGLPRCHTYSDVSVRDVGHRTLDIPEIVMCPDVA